MYVKLAEKQQKKIKKKFFSTERLSWFVEKWTRGGFPREKNVGKRKSPPRSFCERGGLRKNLRPRRSKPSRSSAVSSIAFLAYFLRKGRYGFSFSKVSTVA